MSGFDSNGSLQKLTVEEILNSINADQKSGISSSLVLTSDTPLGQINGVVADRIADLWDALEAANTARNPAAAGGVALDAIVAITGTKREQPTHTTVDGITVNIDPGVTLLAGTTVASVNGDPTRRFDLAVTVTNTTGATANITTDINGSPITFTSEVAGAVQCLAGQLTIKATPQTGWNSITNAHDGIEGSTLEADAALRNRQQDELAGGGSTADAIRDAVLRDTANNGATSVRVLENDTHVTDANGLPRKSFEVIAYGPDSPSTAQNQALADLIRATKPAGTQAFGTSFLNSTDAEGNVFSIGFTRPTIDPIYLFIQIVKNPALYPADGDAQIAAAIAAYDPQLIPGATVYAEKLKSLCFSVPGVVTVSDFPLTQISGGSPNLIENIRSKAKLDTSRITVTSVNM